LTLDNWEPEQLHVMLNLGNRLVNMIYEADMRRDSSGLSRPTAHSSSEHRRQWARAKWAQCQFARLPAAETDLENMTSDWIRQLYNTWCELREQHQQHLSSTGTPSPGPRAHSKLDHVLEVNDFSKRRTATRQSHRRAILSK
uniref:Arf-GAP domain-containing protein n=1 Tax=Echinostoma caproni TaxID=27848 RepID=A0A183BEQ6_9TREM